MAKLVDVLTPEKILGIYKETGLRPAVGGFCPDGGKGPKDCYCPMGAFVMSKDPRTFEIGADDDGMLDNGPCLTERIADLLGIEDDSEVWSFIDGFDSNGIYDETFSDAYQLGIATRNLLQIHYGPLVDLSTFPSDPVSVDED